VSQLSLFDETTPPLRLTWQSLGAGWAVALMGAYNQSHFWGTPNGWYQTACGMLNSGGPVLKLNGQNEFISQPTPPADACPDCAKRWLAAVAALPTHVHG